MRPDLPILFASGYADVPDLRRGAGGRDGLKKPFRIAEVAARVREAIEARTAAQGGNVVEFRKR
jgi:FixJ family two-component response regulator